MWKKHDASKNPHCPVCVTNRVIVQFCNGDISFPVIAGEIDWYDIGDNVIRYRVPRTDISALQRLCSVKIEKKLANEIC